MLVQLIQFNPAQYLVQQCNNCDIFIHAAHQHLGSDGLSRCEPIPGEEEGDPEEWIDDILSLGIWVDTWQYTQASKTQASPDFPPSTCPITLTLAFTATPRPAAQPAATTTTTTLPAAPTSPPPSVTTPADTTQVLQVPLNSALPRPHDLQRYDKIVL